MSTRLKYIVTHPGSAHRDEFLAIGLIFYHLGQCNVHRREPTPEELADPQIAVVDVGGRHEPEKLNFDHHQVKGSPEDPRCAASLVAEYFGHQDTLRELFPWWTFTELMDCCGPKVATTQHGLAMGALQPLLSPIEAAMIKMFESSTVWNQGQFILLVAEQVWKTYMPYSQGLARLIEELGQHADYVRVGGVLVLDLRTFGAPVAPAAIERYITQQSIDPALVVSRDDRGDGWSIFRRQEHTDVLDLNAIKDEPGVTFVHANGFIAKTTRAADPLQLIELAGGRHGKKR